MDRALPRVVVAVLLFPSLLLAQLARNEEGFELGSIRVRPVAEVLGAYDNRVSINNSNGDTSGDLYTELAAALYLENNPARYDFSANAGYGYRVYRDYTDLDSDFYQAGIAVASAESPLKLGWSSYLKKTLDYDTVYEASGQGPGAILTGDPSTRYTTTANIAYEKNLTDKTSITPGYDVWHYFQDFENGTDAEWQEHRASLQLGYGYTEKTKMFLTGYYSLQVNDKEDGTIGSILVGAEGRMSDKTSWVAHIGLAAADYEVSGADQGVVGLLRANWETTEKLSAYIYGLSNFQPGYNGGSARRVYRLGCGATWRVVSRWSILAQLLHDYQEGLGDTGSSNGDVKNFLSVRTEYDLTQRLAVGASVRYIMDEEESDQTIAALSAMYRY